MIPKLELVGDNLTRASFIGSEVDINALLNYQRLSEIWPNIREGDITGILGIKIVYMLEKKSNFKKKMDICCNACSALLKTYCESLMCGHFDTFSCEYFMSVKNNYIFNWHILQLEVNIDLLNRHNGLEAGSVVEAILALLKSNYYYLVLKMYLLHQFLT